MLQSSTKVRVVDEKRGVRITVEVGFAGKVDLRYGARPFM